MKALILAAGYATRLYPLTKRFPKPLLEVEGRPIIDYIIDKLRPIPLIDEIIVVTNSKFISYFKKWAKRLKLGKRLTLVDDLTKTIEGSLGAIGDMNFAINKMRIKDDLLVVGGDNLFDSELKSFLSFALQKKNSPLIGAYDIKSRLQAKKYGVIKLDRFNRIVDFQEKPDKPKSTLAATCIYYFPKAKLKLIKEYLASRENKRDATGFYINWLTKRSAVYGFVFEGSWYDIGDYKFYNLAKEKFTKINKKEHNLPLA